MKRKRNPHWTGLALCFSAVLMSLTVHAGPSVEKYAFIASVYGNGILGDWPEAGPATGVTETGDYAQLFPEIATGTNADGTWATNNCFDFTWPLFADGFEG